MRDLDVIKALDSMFDLGESAFKHPDMFRCFDVKFPPADVLVDKDHNLKFRYALAGYKEEDIDIEFSADTMTLKVGKSKDELKDGEVERFRYLNRGIKRSQFKVQQTILTSQYDIEKTEAVFENGILEIFIPSKEDMKPRKIKLKSK